MTMRARASRLLAFMLLAVGCSAAPAKAPTTADILDHVKRAPEHPRLFLTSGAEDAIRRKADADPRLRSALEAVLLAADHDLSEPPVVYRKEGRRLLGRSREALDRMTHLCMAYRLTRERKYADRAITEIRAMAEMPDWNPSHFLDVGEMTLAIAIGYDWLQDQLSSEMKEMAGKAIEEKGLGPYLKPGSKHGWERGGNNWNPVCHAGMLAGALALAERDPERAATVVQRAVAGLPYAMKVYDPDGNYPEGPGYWSYGTTFNVLAIAMLETALGTDFGLSESPGFLKAADFPLHTTGPTRLPFNFSDGGMGLGFNPAVAWFAARTGRPELMWFQWELLDRGVRRVRDTKGAATLERTFPLSLLWAEPAGKKREPSQRVWVARGENPLAIFRSSWSDPDALYLAIKAGTPGASHGHMDIGSFVLDALGERWSLDLGAEDYNKLEQRGIGLWSRRQGGDRWKIFRYHNRAHSTLLVNDAEQIVTSTASIIDYRADPNAGYAVVDMTEAYKEQLAGARRRFSFSPSRITIEDELTGGDSASTVRWGMVTRAKLESEGKSGSFLLLNGKKLRIQVEAPADAALKSWPAIPPNDYDAQNPGVSIVGFEVPVKASERATLKVRLSP